MRNKKHLLSLEFLNGIINGYMYSRILEHAPDHIVQNGKINFGSFYGIPKKIDIRGVKAPFAGVPTWRFFSNFRIKSRIFFVFSNEQYIGMVEFFDDKAFGIAEVIFWDKNNGLKYAYHSFMGPRRRFVPTNTQNAACNTFGKNRNIKISWNRKNNTISMTFLVKGDKFRPAAKARFNAYFPAKEEGELLTVTPAPTTQRCSATWTIPLKVEGGIQLAKTRKEINPIQQEKGLGIMLLNRIYLKFHSSSEVMFGLINKNEKNIVFHFSTDNQESLDPDQFNDNYLSVDGQITALPPVCITHPFGIEKKWIVQDTESMVDLSFTPISLAKRTLNIILMRNAYSKIYGTFDGVLMTKDGEKIILKNCPGIVKKNLLRL